MDGRPDARLTFFDESELMAQLKQQRQEQAKADSLPSPEPIALRI